MESLVSVYMRTEPPLITSLCNAARKHFSVNILYHKYTWILILKQENGKGEEGLRPAVCTSSSAVRSGLYCDSQRPYKAGAAVPVTANCSVLVCAPKYININISIIKISIIVKIS